MSNNVSDSEKNAPQTAKIEEIKSILGNPAIDDLSENTLRIRRNLVIYCCIVIFSFLYKISIGSAPAFMGLTFDGITIQVVYDILFWIILYNLAHFIIYISEYIIHSRIRLTGKHSEHSTRAGFVSSHDDLTADKRQSTLYAYLLRKIISPLHLAVKNTEKQLNNLSENLQIDNKATNQDVSVKLNSIIESLASIKKNCDMLISHPIEPKDPYIKISLERFDKWFRNFNNAQVFRLLIFEIVLPIVLAIFALYITWPFSLLEKSKSGIALIEQGDIKNPILIQSAKPDSKRSLDEAQRNQGLDLPKNNRTAI